jgi:hypothetical protein
MGTTHIKKHEKGVVLAASAAAPRKPNSMLYNTLGHKKTSEKTKKSVDTQTPVVSNIQMKNVKTPTLATHSITTRKEGFHIGIGQYTLSIGGGSGHYCENYMRPYNADNEPTATMEVALMNSGGFVVLDNDVAAYVSVAHLPELILAVEREDWQTFADLCEADLSLFPE